MTFYGLNVRVNRKKIKNMYVTIDEDLNVVVSANYLVPSYIINDFLKENKEGIFKLVERRKRKNIKEKAVFYFGKEMKIIYKDVKDAYMENNIIYALDEKMLNKWYNKQMKKVFSERLAFNYNLFEEQIPFPNLRIRTMKTRWGVCNKAKQTITLNSLLIKEDMECLDYVIIHELSHFIHFNHSKNFWNLVSKYSPDYKRIQKKLKE